MSSRKSKRVKSSSSSVTSKAKIKPAVKTNSIENVLENLKHDRDRIELLRISDQNRTQTDMLSLAEKTNLISIRAKQIEQTGESFINPFEFGITDSIKIAEKELELGKCPLLIRRNVSNKNIVEYWDPNKMIH